MISSDSDNGAGYARGSVHDPRAICSQGASCTGFHGRGHDDGNIAWDCGPGSARDCHAICNPGASYVGCRARGHDDGGAGGTHRRRFPGPGAQLHPESSRAAAEVLLGR